MAQLAQAYLHLKPYRASRRRLINLGKTAELLALEAAKRIYGGDVVVDVELEEGSLRVRVTVAGFLIAAYGIVADYKGFKESVTELCNDAKQYAIDVCEPFKEEAGASDQQVYRFERRTKTAGKLYRLAKHLEKLEKSAAEISSKDMQRELAEANRELSSLMRDLSPAEAEFVETKLIKSTGLPPPSRWPSPAPEQPRTAIRDDEQLLLDDDFGVPLRVPKPAKPGRRLIYQNRVYVDAQLPGVDPKTAKGALNLRLPTDR